MNVYLNKDRLWSHLRTNQKLTWGSNNKIIPSVSNIDSEVFYPVKREQNKIGPIVGILTASHPKKHFTGNLRLFLALQKELFQSGGILIIFTPQPLQQGSIDGFVFQQRAKKWVKTRLPLPDVVYNRYPYRNEEQTGRVQAVLNELNKLKIPFFNPHFFNKQDIFHCLRQDKKLRSFLPHTIKFSTYDDLVTLQHSFRKIYVKPVQGAKGTGIFTLTFKKNYIVLQTHQQKIVFNSIAECWNDLKRRIKNKTYIAQEAIKLNSYLNRKYDLRIHACNISDNWIISGIGVRLAAINGITTHVPQGGETLPIEKISKFINEGYLKFIIEHIGKALEKNYGLVKEFSTDIGQDSRGNYYLFEVNAKPMTFDEEDVEKQRVKNVIKTFYELSKFSYS